jgi:Kef-type K+ transport system membrane component KefB
MDMSFLPSLPFTLSYPLLFGVLVVAGMLGGELAHAARLPRIIGYVLVGFVAAPLAEAVQLRPLLDEARIFVDLALGLVLFDLGRRVDLRWMGRDRSLAAAGLLESGLAFGAVFFTLEAFDFPPLQAAVAAAIAMATSPAVVLLVAQDTRAEGQVTERALNLVAMNSLVASILVTMLFAAVHYQSSFALEAAILHPLYLFLGSVTLGAAMSTLTRAIARRLEKTNDLHFTLIAGMVVAAVGVATLFKLSVILSLLAFGLFARNAERSHDLLSVDLGRASRLLYIVLFVITGASLPAEALAAAGWVAVALVAARAAGKLVGVALVTPFSHLNVRQVAGLAAALMPMSSLALLLQHDISANFPGFGEELSVAVLGGVIIAEILGPLLVQWGFWISGETAPEPAVQAPRAATERAT